MCVLMFRAMIERGSGDVQVPAKTLKLSANSALNLCDGTKSLIM